MTDGLVELSAAWDVGGFGWTVDRTGDRAATGGRHPTPKQARRPATPVAPVVGNAHRVADARLEDGGRPRVWRRPLRDDGQRATVRAEELDVDGRGRRRGRH
jgi:hypothetical protein